MSDLSLATIEELLDELEKRADELIVVMRTLIDKDEEEYTYKYRHPQRSEHTIWLLRHLEHSIMCRAEATQRDPEPWEEL